MGGDTRLASDQQRDNGPRIFSGPFLISRASVLCFLTGTATGHTSSHRRDRGISGGDFNSTACTAHLCGNFVNGQGTGHFGQRP